MPKRRHRSKTSKTTEKPVFTFRQMERVVDLIDRQARLLTGEKRLPSDDYTYAKNEGVVTIFYYDSASNTYYFTLKARYPAIENYYDHGKGQEYKDGTVGVYLNNSGAIRYRIYLEDSNMYAKFNPNDANHAESTITFYNIPRSTVLNMNKLGYIKKVEGHDTDYFTNHPVDYFRDVVAGEDPPL
jgi:hypothetical protein